MCMLPHFGFLTLTFYVVKCGLMGVKAEIWHRNPISIYLVILNTCSTPHPYIYSGDNRVGTSSQIRNLMANSEILQYNGFHITFWVMSVLYVFENIDAEVIYCFGQFAQCHGWCHNWQAQRNKQHVFFILMTLVGK